MSGDRDKGDNIWEASSIPPDVSAAVHARLTSHAAQQYGLAGVELTVASEDVHLVVYARSSPGSGTSMLGAGLHPICRMHWTGNPESWGFSLYLPMEKRFSKRGEYGAFERGSPEDCLDEGVRVAIYGEGPF